MNSRSLALFDDWVQPTSVEVLCTQSTKVKEEAYDLKSIRISDNIDM